MEFYKNKWSCPYSIDKNCGQKSARGWGQGLRVIVVVKIGASG